MSNGYFLKTDLDKEPYTFRQDFEPYQAIVEDVVKRQERRKDQHEFVRHFLALIIIIPYIVLLAFGSIYNFSIPKSYETLALIIIGYYFAKHFV